MITCVCGLPGNGKTTYLTKVAVDKLKKGLPVYTSYPVKVKFKGIYLYTKKLTKDMLLKHDFELGATLIIDEAQNWFNSRYWKEFGKEFMEFFTGHRHLDLTLLMGVQFPKRIDVSLREIMDSYDWIEPFSILKIKIPGKKRIETYYALEDIKKRDLPKEFMKKRNVKINKKIYLSFDDKYLKDKLRSGRKESEKLVYYEEFPTRYIPAYEKIWKNVKHYYQFRKEIMELKKTGKLKKAAKIRNRKKPSNS